MPEKISGQEARQGDRNPSLLKALIIALVIAVLVWGGVEIYGMYLTSDTTQLDQLTEDQPQTSGETVGSVDDTGSSTEGQPD